MTRAGQYISQSSGYKAFIPNPLPPNPPINFDIELIKLLSDAERALGRLDGAAEILPNPDLFVGMFVKKEAVLSSQIEGTQASLVDVLEFDADEQIKKGSDVGDVVNYINAMNYGLERLDKLPLSLRLIREIHSVLLQGTRGADKDPGEFRKSQNWIGPSGSTLANASFVPPAVEEMKKAMGDLELYMHDESSNLPHLIKIGLIHCQFETIHPFLDGNGRVGRLLITFYLVQKGILNKPLLYLSYYFKKNRIDYYEWLMQVRLKGRWEDWLKFFLKGVIEVSNSAIEISRKILQLQSTHKSVVMENNNTQNALKLIDLLYLRPVITINDVVDELGITYPTASTLVKSFEEINILKEKTGQQRNRVYGYTEYIEILEEDI